MLNDKQNGFTIVELAIVIAIIAIMSAFAVTSFVGTEESNDATAVQAVHAILQNVISQGTSRLDLTVSDLKSTQAGAIEQAVQSYIQQNGATNNGVTFSKTNWQVTLKSGRTAQFDIQNNGDVLVNNVNQFQYYSIRNGVICKKDGSTCL